MASWQSLLSSPLVTYTIVAPVTFTLLLLAITYLGTNIRYRLNLRQARHVTGQTCYPAKIPYTIPVLGSALEFLNTRPGAFWEYLLKWHPRNTGACTLTMGGQSMHVLFDAQAIQALFKAREPMRHELNHHVATKAFGVDRDEATNYYAVHEGPSEKFDGRTPQFIQEHLWASTLIRTDRVNELTAQFMKFLATEISDDTTVDGMTEKTGLCTWLRGRMFRASTKSIFGTSFLEAYPDLEEDYFYFDQNFLTTYFGIPRWLSPKIYAVRDRLHQKMAQWHEGNREKNKGHVADPEGVAWEPIQGSRTQRARLLYCEAQGLSLQSQARLDLGFLFAVSSNTMPTTGWMLMHILDPNGDKTLYPRVMEEIEASRHTDGSIDVAVLVNQPLLLSVFHEVLRLYVDNLVTRELHKDLTLPIGAPSMNAKILLSKGAITVAPTWTEHHEPEFWGKSGVDANAFYAERFLVENPETGDKTFSTAGTGGKFFPFGGGKTICPGKAFARQEVMGTVAMMLTQFEFEVLGYLGRDGKSRCKTFPDLADAYPGGAVLAIRGDLEVKMTRRKK